jgi:hypothetical protein
MFAVISTLSNTSWVALSFHVAWKTYCNNACLTLCWEWQRGWEYPWHHELFTVFVSHDKFLCFESALSSRPVVDHKLHIISTVQTPGFSPPKFSSSVKFAVKIRSLMEISHFKVEALSLFLILRLRMNISYYMFVASLRGINASIYLFVDGFRFFL